MVRGGGGRSIERFRQIRRGRGGKQSEEKRKRDGESVSEAMRWGDGGGVLQRLKDGSSTTTGLSCLHNTLTQIQLQTAAFCNMSNLHVHNKTSLTKTQILKKTVALVAKTLQGDMMTVLFLRHS